MSTDELEDTTIYKVVVNHDAGKFASAHELRRAFGLRLAQKVMPAMHRELMRHQASSSKPLHAALRQS